jgi:hypothetical protein
MIRTIDAQNAMPSLTKTAHHTAALIVEANVTPAIKVRQHKDVLLVVTVTHCVHSGMVKMTM